MKLSENSFLLVLSVLLGSVFFSCYGDEIVDEEALFSDEMTVVESEKFVEVKGEIPGLAKRSLGVSLELSGDVLYESKRDEKVKGDNDISSFLVTNLLVDGRFFGVKGFLNWEMDYQARSGEFDDYVREGFFDLNLQNRFFFKVGKQVLQWGRCYFWNPTDLINYDRKVFTERVGYRSGVYGVKMHVASGTLWNFYGFWDVGGSEFDEDEMALALKFEFLAGATEMAFSVWKKERLHSVLGYDFSSRVFKVDLVGEVTFTKEGDRVIMEEGDGVLFLDKGDEDWVMRACLSGGRSFNWGDHLDRVSVRCEFFYNGLGYEGDVLGDEEVYVYESPLFFGGEMIGGGDKKTFALGHGLYERDYFSTFYAALFSSFQKFVHRDLTLNVNWIGNLEDGSSILSTGVTYSHIKDWSAGVFVYRYFGNEGTEYVLGDQRLGVQFSVGAVF